MNTVTFTICKRLDTHRSKCVCFFFFFSSSSQELKKRLENTSRLYKDSDVLDEPVLSVNGVMMKYSPHTAKGKKKVIN